MILNETLNFAERIKEAIIKARRGIGIIRFLSKHVHRDVLDRMYKLYVRPHSDYGDFVHHNQNSSLMSKIESTQYAVALAVSGAWRGTNTDKLLMNSTGNLWPIGDGTEDFAYSITNNSTPEYTRRYLPTSKQNPYDLRRPSIFAEEILKQLLSILYQGLEQP